MTSRAEGAWLIDKSALIRLGTSPDIDLWAARIERGLVRMTTVTRHMAPARHRPCCKPDPIGQYPAAAPHAFRVSGRLLGMGRHDDDDDKPKPEDDAQGGPTIPPEDPGGEHAKK